MRIGYFEHWSRPIWSFIDFLKADGYDIEKIDFSKKGYLEKYDVVLIEQNGFNDYVEIAFTYDSVERMLFSWLVVQAPVLYFGR